MTDRSLRQLYSIWVGLAIFGVVIAYVLFRALAQEEGSSVVFAVGGAVFGSLVAGYVLIATKRRIGRLLQSPNSEPLIQHFQRMSGKVPRRDAMVAHSCALTATLYGDFERAKAFLQSVQWAGRGRIYEAMPLQVRTLILYWQDRDYVRGLVVAREAYELGRLEAPLPGAGVARLAYGVLVASGKVLTGESDADDIETLRRGAKRLPILAKVVAMWGLALAHQRKGEHAEAEAVMTELRRVAPHCKPLLSIPT